MDPGYSAATNRASWCSAWVDCYETGVEGVRILVAVDNPGETATLHVMGVGEERRHISSTWTEAPGAGFVGGSMGAILLRADLDANGTIDLFFADYGCSNGISICEIRGLFALVDPKTRDARITRYRSEGMALIDLDGNGRAEILSRDFTGASCTDGKHHNFWITQLLGFQDLGIVDLRQVHTIRNGGFAGRFPSFEWLSFDPKDRFRPLLTEAQRSELGRTSFPPYQGVSRKPAADAKPR